KLLRRQPLPHPAAVPPRRRGGRARRLRRPRPRLQTTAARARGGARLSLSEDVRSEVALIDPRKPCCRLAELSALLRTAGSVHLRGGGRVSLHLEVQSPAVARRTFSLLRAFSVPCEIRTFRRQAFDRS